MTSSFFLILQNTFLSFLLIPFSSGTYYSLGVIFFGFLMPYIAKIIGISLAIVMNFFVGFLFRKVLRNKRFPDSSPAILYLSLLTFIPVISAIVAFYCGVLKVNFIKFFLLSLIINVFYYGVAIYFPELNISF